MKLTTVLCLIACAAGISFPVRISAQNINVVSAVDANDFVGNNFIFSLKEHLRKSATYVVLDESDGKCIEINLVSLNTGDGSSAISVLTRMPWSDGGDYVIDHELLIVGRSRVDEMAASLVASTDTSLSKLRTTFKTILNKSPTPATQ